MNGFFYTMGVTISLFPIHNLFIKNVKENFIIFPRTRNFMIETREHNTGSYLCLDRKVS